jgi:hypothetical protein
MDAMDELLTNLLNTAPGNEMEFKVEIAAWGEDIEAGSTSTVREGLSNLGERLRGFLASVDKILESRDPERIQSSLGIEKVNELRVELTPSVSVLVRRAE